MKKIFIYSFLVLSFLGCSSNSDTTLNSIIGKWQWVQSSGGITGATSTPSSEGKAIQIEIAESTLKIYENANLVATESYSIETKNSILGGQRQMLVYLSGKSSQSFIVDKNKLFLSDECTDCYQSEYVRK